MVNIMSSMFVLHATRSRVSDNLWHAENARAAPFADVANRRRRRRQRRSRSIKIKQTKTIARARAKWVRVRACACVVRMLTRVVRLLKSIYIYAHGARLIAQLYRI